MIQDKSMVIARLGLEPSTLDGETVIVTGAGGGIGYEAARALLWLGANVIIAEINQSKGLKAQEVLEREFDLQHVLFVRTDVGDEASVQNLYNQAILHFGKVDAILNNATIAVLGEVKDVPIEEWDRSYRVNLRGPVLMAKAFLPDMIKRNHGTFACVSSTGTAFLGGYETFKAAQVHLGNTLDAELEGTGVIAYTIGPGLVPTETASNAVAQLALQMGMTVEQFFEMNKSALLSVEEAGAGFAASIVLASKFRGQEISSIQALKALDITFGDAEETEKQSGEIEEKKREQLQALCGAVYATLKEQAEGWKSRSLFERQWVIRDFRKTAGMPVEEWLETLRQLTENLQRGTVSHPPLEKLAGYYEHLADLAKGYEKNKTKLEENLQHVYRWRDEVKALAKMM